MAGSFPAVSKRNLARKYAFDSIFQYLQDVHTFAPLKTQQFNKKSIKISAPASRRKLRSREAARMHKHGLLLLIFALNCTRNQEDPFMGAHTRHAPYGNVRLVANGGKKLRSSAGLSHALLPVSAVLLLLAVRAVRAFG